MQYKICTLIFPNWRRDTIWTNVVTSLHTLQNFENDCLPLKLRQEFTTLHIIFTIIIVRAQHHTNTVKLSVYNSMILFLILFHNCIIANYLSK
jgi:hypothetical protein